MIDEKKLIEDIEKEIEFAMKCNMPAMVAGMRQIASVIEEQPKIGEWIPCSERLPEMHREDMEAEGEYYMISNPVIVTDGKQIYISLNTKLIWITDMVGTALMEKIMII